MKFSKSPFPGLLCKRSVIDAHSWDLGAEGGGFPLVEAGKGLEFQSGLGSCSVIFSLPAVCSQEAEESLYECLEVFQTSFANQIKPNALDWDFLAVV